MHPCRKKSPRLEAITGRLETLRSTRFVGSPTSAPHGVRRVRRARRGTVRASAAHPVRCPRPGRSSSSGCQPHGSCRLLFDKRSPMNQEDVHSKWDGFIDQESPVWRRQGGKVEISVLSLEKKKKAEKVQKALRWCRKISVQQFFRSHSTQNRLPSRTPQPALLSQVCLGQRRSD